MRHLSLILFFTLINACSNAVVSKEDKYKDFQILSSFICSQLIDKPSFSYKDKFSEIFRKAVSYKQLVAIFQSIYKDHGRCEGHKATTNDGLNGTFLTEHKVNTKLNFSLNLKKAGEGYKIAGLRFNGKKEKPVNIENYDQLKEIAEKQSGNFSVLITDLDGNELFSFKEKNRRALGSVFKLYILATLLDKVEKKELSWSEKYPIVKNLKSLPSGTMQNLKLRTKVSIEEFASKMISISDNTATDHLLNIVKKDQVEELMKLESLNDFVKDNSPFLSTLDMFKTRGFFDKKQVSKYVQSSKAIREKMISNVPFKGNKDLLSKLSTWTLPKYISEIEWFATPANICSLYNWMDKKNDSYFRKVMAINVPFVDSKKWNYAGFKGGSEPGVLEMAYLLEKKNGKRICLYIGHNNTKEPIEQIKFFEIVKGTMGFLEKQ